MFYKKRIIDLRYEQDLKQLELAEILKIAPTTYNNYENEYEIMPIKHLNNLCNYFNVSLDYIMGFTSIRNYSNSKSNINNYQTGKRLKSIRKEKQLKQVNLAEFLNTSQSTIAKIETGENALATPFLYQICKKYNISADYLLGKIDEPKYLK